jgi:hypothetical protein
MEPAVLHLIPCNDIETDSSNHQRFNIVGLITSIRSSQSPPFPVSHSNLIVLVVWTGGQGEGELEMRITDAGSQNAIFRTRSRRVSLAVPMRLAASRFESRIVRFRRLGYTGLRCRSLAQ